MNCLSLEKRKQIIHLLVEGNSVRGTARLAGVQKNTVLKLLAEVGQACAEYQDKHMVSLPCKTVQVDEIHSYVYSRQKNTQVGKQGAGAVWTWVAMEAESKLIISWHVGDRKDKSAEIFIEDLYGRLANRVQITSDGLGSYQLFIEKYFGADVDYGMLVKKYDARQRYIGAERKMISGHPDPGKLSTNYIERQNLTMRMDIRRFHRRTNAFSKKFENHCHAIALHFMHYNFCRIHSSLRVTPAMAAGISDHVWGIEEMIKILTSEK